MNPAITVVSGTYNRLILLQQMVASARAARPASIPVDFVIVDGGSTDGTQDWCRSQADITLIEHGELLGAIKAFCDGAKAARGKYVVLANDDVVFHPHSLTRALVHLESTPVCGGVAFADNRPGPYKRGGYRTERMPARAGGQAVAVIYAQVGMFRRWLGDLAGWWGADDPDFASRTYGGDNYLSSRIWELGYKVQEVDGCAVDDLVAADALREINMGPASAHPGHPDTEAYYQRYPEGALIPDGPQIEQQDKRRLRILYLPIFEPGHAVQRTQKRGLREALARVGYVWEIDYLNSREPEREIGAAIDTFRPDLLLTQIHAPKPITPEMLYRLRLRAPGMVVVNWNGDYWPDGLVSEEMLRLLRHVDLQLVVNASVLATYEQHNIPAAYWQIGFEDPGDADSDLSVLPHMAAHDVVFLANAYDPRRKELGRQMNFWHVAEGWSLGLYGSGWEALGMGETLYDFAAGKALYRNARIAIGDNLYPEAVGFVSNRLFQALAAGGCVLLHQEVPGLQQLTGLIDGVHYLSWKDSEDLREKIAYLLDHETERKQIAEAGTAFVREQHSFDARVREMFTRLLPLAKRRLQTMVALRYTGRIRGQFGVKGVKSGRHYVARHDALLFVDQDDLPFVMRDGVWERVEAAAPGDAVAQAAQEAALGT